MTANSDCADELQCDYGATPETSPVRGGEQMLEAKTTHLAGSTVTMVARENWETELVLATSQFPLD